MFVANGQWKFYGFHAWIYVPVASVRWKIRRAIVVRFLLNYYFKLERRWINPTIINNNSNEQFDAFVSIFIISRRYWFIGRDCEKCYWISSSRRSTIALYSNANNLNSISLFVEITQNCERPYCLPVQIESLFSIRTM